MAPRTETLHRAERALSHLRPTLLDRFLYGAAYYPEHWDEETRREDPARMAAAGMNVVRMAEFAWDMLEPREGEYDFSFFDEQIARLAERGIATILCTPTAAPPRWLTRDNPDVLRVDANDQMLQHGSRQHACHSSVTFRGFSRQITRVMAEHYERNPNVIGWQTDNEINCHFSECHCLSCQQAFSLYLSEEFDGDIGALNRAWGTAFWAQTYQNFDDIPTPRPGKPTYANPAHLLDYYRFIASTVADFQAEQVGILRTTQPNWFVFHNGVMRHVDYRGRFTRDLDFLGYDVYPFFVNDPITRRYGQAYGLDGVRAYGGNFIVPEHQSGPGGQGDYLHDTPEPGELRRMVYTSIARGADSILFFRWRTARFGAEIYWHGILDHDNVPRRRYDEVARLGEELKSVGPAILGTEVRITAAVASGDYDAREAHGTYPLGLPNPDHMGALVHRALEERGYAVGCVHPSDDLVSLKLYVIPHWTVFDPAWVAGLERWVEAGGTLVIGARTACRDLDNNVIAETLPGCLAPLAGVLVQEYGRLNAGGKRPLGMTMEAGVAPGSMAPSSGSSSFAARSTVVPSIAASSAAATNVGAPSTTVPAEHWYEILAPADGTEVLARWEGRHQDGQVAITRRRRGEGSVVYVGTYLSESLLAALVPALAALAGLEPAHRGAPQGVEVVQRRGIDRDLWFFINHSEEPAVVTQAPRGEDLVTHRQVAGELRLEPNGVAVVVQSRA
jgi:beta-galactosidase